MLLIASATSSSSSKQPLVEIIGMLRWISTSEPKLVIPARFEPNNYASVSRPNTVFTMVFSKFRIWNILVWNHSGGLRLLTCSKFWKFSDIFSYIPLSVARWNGGICLILRLVCFYSFLLHLCWFYGLRLLVETRDMLLKLLSMSAKLTGHVEVMYKVCIQTKHRLVH